MENVELRRKGHSRWGQQCGGGQPQRKREQVMSGDTAQSSELEPQDQGNKDVWEGHGHIVKPRQSFM